MSTETIDQPREPRAPGLMRLTTALQLGRVSNLPTVWTNALAAATLAGASFGPSALLAVLLALSLFYMGGMWLNDAFDAEIDARERANRPIPRGEAKLETVFAGGFAMIIGGMGIAAGFGGAAALSGAGLAAAILAYDVWHKGNALSPVLMGLCRLGAYALGAYALASAETVGPALLFGLGLLAYVIGLTYAAKQEAYDKLEAAWPLGVLAIPLAMALYGTGGDGLALILWLVFAAWTASRVRLLFRREKGDVPTAVVGLIAGIALYDAVLIAGMGAPLVALLAVAGFGATLWLQRVASGT